MENIINNLVSSTENIDIHRIIFNGNPLYFVHVFRRSDTTNNIESGDVFLLYKDTELGCYHSYERPVLNYKLINTVDGIDYIELSNMYIDENYRRKGIGSLLLRYFESKLVEKYYCNASYIKGIMLIGEEKKLRNFYSINGYDIHGSIIVKKLHRQL